MSSQREFSNQGALIKSRIKGLDDPTKQDVDSIQKEVGDYYQKYKYGSEYLKKNDYCDQNTRDTFTLQKHQMFVAEYVKNQANLLVFHGLGSGKTCTSIAAAELHKHYKNDGSVINSNNDEAFKVIICCPKSVQAEYTEQLLGECSSHILIDGKSQSYKDKGFQRKISEAQTLIKHSMMIQADKAVNSQEKNKAANVIKKQEANLKEYYTKYKSKLSKNYCIMSHTVFANSLFNVNSGNGPLLQKNKDGKKDISWLTRPNTLLIIDEIQNIVSVPCSTYCKKFTSALRNYVHPKTRIMGLTATPIFNKPAEIGITLNLLNPRITFPVDVKDFDLMFVERNDNSGSERLTNVKLLKHLFAGSISYFSGGNPSAYPYVINTEVHSEMSKLQQDHYIQEFGKDLSKYTKVQDVIGWAMDEAVDSAPKFFTSARGALQIFRNPAFWKKLKKLKTRGEKLALLEQHSCKMHRIMTLVLDSKRTRPVYIYSSLVRDGAKPLFDLFGYFGYNGDGERVAKIMTGETDAATKKKYINGVNNGTIDVLIGTVTEGISFKGLEQLHILEPWWNTSRIKQIQARGIRFKSHCNLPESERFIKIYNHVGCLQNKKTVLGLQKMISDRINELMGNYNPTAKETLADRTLVNLGLKQFSHLTIDQVMKGLAEKKSLLTTQIENAMKDSAVDYKLNKLANVTRFSQYFLPTANGFKDYHVLYQNPIDGKFFQENNIKIVTLGDISTIYPNKQTDIQLWECNVSKEGATYAFTKGERLAKRGLVQIENFGGERTTAAKFKKMMQYTGNSEVVDYMRKGRKESISKKLSAFSHDDLAKKMREISKRKGIDVEDENYKKQLIEYLTDIDSFVERVRNLSMKDLEVFTRERLQNALMKADAGYILQYRVNPNAFEKLKPKRLYALWKKTLE